VNTISAIFMTRTKPS